MLVKELMKQAYTIEKDIDLAEAAEVMSSKGIGSLIFLSNGNIKGIITERDLLKNFNKVGKVSKVMSKKVITIKSEADVATALDMMKNYKKKKLPVVEKKKLVGIINLIDIATNADEVGEGFFFN
jgi:CBS domain-containing protein